MSRITDAISKRTQHYNQDIQVMVLKPKREEDMRTRTRLIMPLALLGLLTFGNVPHLAAEELAHVHERAHHLQEMADEWADREAHWNERQEQLAAELADWEADEVAALADKHGIAVKAV